MVSIYHNMPNRECTLVFPGLEHKGAPHTKYSRFWWVSKDYGSGWHFLVCVGIRDRDNEQAPIPTKISELNKSNTQGQKRVDLDSEGLVDPSSKEGSAT